MSELVYCTNCTHFKIVDESPFCIYRNYCNINDCEDSKQKIYRPYYQEIKTVSSKEALKDVIPIKWSESEVSGDTMVVIDKYLEISGNKWTARDRNRINPLLNEFEKLWLQFPDLRFGQLVYLISSKLNKNIFSVEDDEWLKCIQDFTKGDIQE